MPLKVCFIALNAYPAIDPRAGGGFGGIETRSWLFARGLAQRPDVEVSFLVRHHEPLRQTEFDGVRMILLSDPLYHLRDSLLSRLERLPHFPWIALRQPRWADAVNLPRLAAIKLLRRKRSPLLPERFLEQIDTDLFLTFGVQSHSATVIASAHAGGRPAVLFLGSDGDLDERYLQPGNFVNVYRDRADVCLWTIQQADRILCQTIAQQQRLQDLFQRDAVVLRNPIDLQEWDRRRAEPLNRADTAGLERFALWVGRADPVHKRPQLLIEVAKRCPDVPFLMVLNRRDDVTEDQVRREAPANVRFVESVPFERMPAVMQHAAVLVNTSSLEGFPNTYLQAAACGVQVASLVVEPEFLEQSQAGACAHGDLDVLAKSVQSAWEQPQNPHATAARQWIEREHGLDSQVRALDAVLRETIDQMKNPRRMAGG